jgi:hypothetical protein
MIVEVVTMAIVEVETMAIVEEATMIVEEVTMTIGEGAEAAMADMMIAVVAGEDLGTRIEEVDMEVAVTSVVIGLRVTIAMMTEIASVVEIDRGIAGVLLPRENALSLTSRRDLLLLNETLQMSRSQRPIPLEVRRPLIPLPS